ncbi:hypothetical protein ACFQBQ_00835 [Granulicella cerasi]|uniref:Uncharacterized protein n=1 Tax=Granulicella cerasi TaxID=741063 RepID=A0ABW1Z5K6_9BACT|nr:hypothetical protein [Granulicella cerasi]
MSNVKAMNAMDRAALIAAASKGAGKKAPETDALLQDVRSLDGGNLCFFPIKEGRDAKKEQVRIHALLKNNKLAGYKVRINPNDASQIIIWKEEVAA